MDELLKLKIFTIVGSILGSIGLFMLAIGGGYRRYTGYTEGGNPVFSGIGLVLMVIGGAMIGYRIKKKNK